MTMDAVNKMFNRLPLTQDMMANPVYQTMLNIMKSVFFNKNDLTRMLVMDTIIDISCSVMPSEKYGVYTDLRNVSCNNDDVMHQVIDFYFKNCGNQAPLVISDPNTTRGYNKDALAAFFNLAQLVNDGNPPTSNHVFATMSSIVPIPYKTCEYSRLTPKAVDYLLSLGKPSVDTVQAFLDSCAEKSKVSECNNYEEMISFMLNGTQTVIYCGYRRGVFYGFRHIYGKEANEFTFIKEASYSSESNTYYENHGFEDDNQIFDIRSLVINLWAARTTKAFSSEQEPANNRSYMAAMCGPVKPKFSTYRYVNITPEGEQLYNESQKVIAEAKNDAEYRKSIWFSRAYYARRGTDKVITFCKASIHHRKCAPVVEEAPTVTVYT